MAVRDVHVLLNRYLPILFILFTVLLIPVITSADAVQSKGTLLTAVNSNKICGDQFCSEIGQSKPTPPKGQIIIPGNEETIDVDKEAPSLLYIQTANSGTYIEKDGRHVITLVEVSPSTVWFADRPERVTGHELTELFIAKWGEGEDSFADDPPNAALELLDNNGQSAVFIVELTNAFYDPDSEIVQYDIKILDEPTQGLSHYKIINAKIPSTFEQAVLFIDNASCSSDIPGVDDFYGIDITKGISSRDLIPHTIFDLYGDDSRTQELGDCSYDVPNSLIYERGNFDVDYEVYKSFDELKKSITADVGLSYSSIAVDADIKTQYTHSTDDAESSYFAIVRAYNNLYSLTLETPPLSEDFQNAIDNLPDSYEGNQQAYFDFFSNYGTHYTQQAEYGGHVIYSSQETDTSSISETDFQASVNVKVNEFIGGSVDLSASIDKSSSESKSDSDLIIKVAGSGGDPGKLHVVVTDSSSNSFNDWWATIDDNPGQIGIKYREIYNLVSDSDKKSQLAKALDDYLRQELDYRMTFSITMDDDVQNPHAKIEIGTNQNNPLTAEFSTFTDWILGSSPNPYDDTVITYGGILVTLDANTGKPNMDSLTVILPETKDELIIPTFNEVISSSMKEDTLFFVLIFTPFSTDYADDFSAFEDIGATSFLNIPQGTVFIEGEIPEEELTVDEIADEVLYMLVGKSHLGEGNGQQHFKSTDDESMVISSKKSIIDIVQNKVGFGYFTTQIECEMIGSISKTIEGFTEFTTSTFECN